MSTPDSLPQLRLFFSYSHKDSELRRELDAHLSPLKREGLIQGWYDREIVAGAEWNEEIERNLEAADIILLLVSADFINSDYCYEKEMMRAMEKHASGDARVIPIILRECNWQSTHFGKLQALPTNLMPITDNLWPSRDAVWTDVVKVIREAIGELIRAINPIIDILESIKPPEFLGEKLSVYDMKESAKTLYQNVVMSRFIPDIIIGLNGGGLVVAAAMNASFMKPIGVIDFRNASITYVSLPHISHHLEKVEPQHKKILVTDTKLKSGEALERSKAIIQREYGEDIDIRYGIVLGYGKWDRTLYLPKKGGYHWPIKFKRNNLPVYLAKRTAISPNNDTIIEELHPGWERL